jgi:hypothetical protein
MVVFSDKKTSKNISNFYCKSCDFGCSKKGDWNRHIVRPKHINLTQCDAQVTEKTYYICDVCDKKYSSRNGLWCHKKKCLTEDEDNTQFIDGINIKDKDALVLHLLKQNSDLQNKIIDMASKSNITNNNNNTNNTNTTNIDNKTFNLQFF